MRATERAAHATASPDIHRFATHAEASSALAARVAEQLADAVAARGVASLAVPGGTTPAEFLTALGDAGPDLERVTVMLTDERWVPPDHPRSNAALVGRTLGRRAGRYRWYPLWLDGLSPAGAVEVLDAGTADIAWPLDVVVLGMGEDGHVASLFPGDESGFASGARRFVAVTGPADEPRVSLSASSIVQAREVYLLLRGDAKLDVFSGALGGALPVARVVAARQGRVHVFASN